MRIDDIQIRFGDIDIFNHVNNINAQHYYDLGKMNYYHDVMRLSVMESNPSLVIVNINTSFFVPILIGDKIFVETSIERIGTKSLGFYQRIVEHGSGTVKSECRTIMAAIDINMNTSCELRKEWIDAICVHEHKKIEDFISK